MVEPTYVSTRVDIGAESYIAVVGGELELTATPITPGSFSLVEPNVATSFSGARRYWQYTATADGALRVDALLSMPGPNGNLYGTVRASVYKYTQTGPMTYEVPIQTLHTDEGFTATFVQWGQPADGYGSGSFLVEEGETYIIQLSVLYLGGSLTQWGPVVRLSSLRPAEPTWYQPDDRVVTTYTPPDPDDPWYSNTTPLNPWDELVGIRGESVLQLRVGVSGKFQWDRSFHGLDPISEIGSFLAIDLAWRHCLHGVPQTFWAAPDLNGALSGPPPAPPWEPRQWSGLGGFSDVYSRWEYREGGLGPFDYVSSEFNYGHKYAGFSLHWERYHTGPRVGYTDEELAAIAGVSLTDIVGFVLEDEIPEILAVQVTADDYGVLSFATQPAVLEWWVGVTRFLPELAVESGEEFPLPGVSFGPVHGISMATVDPPFQYINFAGVLVGGEDAKPHDYIQETGMDLVGTYTSGNPVYDVPEATWRAALEVEDEMIANDTFATTPDTQQQVGLTFLAGLAEQTAANPVGPGLPVPVLNDGGEAKGFLHPFIWPKITYRPSRFKVALAPDIEIPLLPIAGSNPNNRQHFEPIPPS